MLGEMGSRQYTWVGKAQQLLGRPDVPTLHASVVHPRKDRRAHFTRPTHSPCVRAARQSNLVKQLSKLVKVRYVEDITNSKRVGE